MNYKNRIKGSALALTLLLASTAGQAAENFRMGTLAPGTSNYIVLTTFANIVNEKLPEYKIQVNATGAGTRHIVDTASKRMEFMMHSPAVHELMKAGTGPFAKLKAAPKLSEELRAVFNFLVGYYHIVTFADSGIETLQDIKGKRVFLGPPGSASVTSTSALLKAATGYEAGKDFEAVKLGWEAATQSFQDGHIDVYFNFTLPPSPAITQIAMMRDIRLLDIPAEARENEEMKKLTSRPGFRLGTIPAGTYKSGQVNANDVAAVEVRATFATHKDMSEQAIYDMTKAFWENVGAHAKNMHQLSKLRLEDVFTDLNMPLHPGAVRYYQEQGMEIPEVALGK